MVQCRHCKHFLADSHQTVSLTGEFTLVHRFVLCSAGTKEHLPEALPTKGSKVPQTLFQQTESQLTVSSPPGPGSNHWQRHMGLAKPDSKEETAGCKWLETGQPRELWTEWGCELRPLMSYSCLTGQSGARPSKEQDEHRVCSEGTSQISRMLQASSC